jgi:hypothetical protein
MGFNATTFYIVLALVVMLGLLVVSVVYLCRRRDKAAVQRITPQFHSRLSPGSAYVDHSLTFQEHRERREEQGELVDDICPVCQTPFTDQDHVDLVTRSHLQLLCHLHCSITE